MNIETACRLAANWWIDAIKSENWDNGDAHTEAVHRAFSSLVPRPTADCLAKLRDKLEVWMNDQFNGSQPTTFSQVHVYCDYGCPVLDDLAKDCGERFISSFHAPQKAGTIIRKSMYGVVSVEAKNGYGAEWVALVDDTEAQP